MREKSDMPALVRREIAKQKLQRALDEKIAPYEEPSRKRRREQVRQAQQRFRDRHADALRAVRSVNNTLQRLAIGSTDAQFAVPSLAFDLVALLTPVDVVALAEALLNNVMGGDAYTVTRVP